MGLSFRAQHQFARPDACVWRQTCGSEKSRRKAISRALLDALQRWDFKVPVVFHSELRAYAAEIVRLAGSSTTEAEIVAANLVEANLQGHDSHGVGLLPGYVDSIMEGGLRPNTDAVLVADHGCSLTYDGQHGYGQVVTRQVMAAGIARALDLGVCLVNLRNSHHLARVGAWAEQCASAGLVSIHFVNVFCRPLVAPFGGTLAKFGTNPFCIGVPRTGQEPLILDFATSAIAFGKAHVAYNKGQKLAGDVLIDAGGKPTSDPAAIVNAPYGALLPFGKHKGGGLALMCSILGGALTGGPTERTADPESALVVNSLLSIIINPAILGGAASFEQEIDAYLPWVRDSRPLNEDEVLFPGEVERKIRSERIRSGIHIDQNTWDQLAEVRTLLSSRHVVI